MLDVVPCVLAAPGRATAPWPTRSRTVRARANDPRRRGLNRVGENFVIGCNIVTLLVRVDRETEIDLRSRAGGYKSRMLEMHSCHAGMSLMNAARAGTQPGYPASGGRQIGLGTDVSWLASF